MYYPSSEVIIGNARGAAVEPTRLRRIFRLHQLTLQVRQQGHIRLHTFGMYVDQNLWGRAVEVLIDDDGMRIEQAEHLLVSYPCVYDYRQRRITAVDAMGRHYYHQVQILQLMFWALELARTVWHMPRYRRASWPSRVRPVPQRGLFD